MNAHCVRVRVLTSDGPLHPACQGGRAAPPTTSQPLGCLAFWPNPGPGTPGLLWELSAVPTPTLRRLRRCGPLGLQRAFVHPTVHVSSYQGSLTHPTLLPVSEWGPVLSQVNAATLHPQSLDVLSTGLPSTPLVLPTQQGSG